MMKTVGTNKNMRRRSALAAGIGILVPGCVGGNDPGTASTEKTPTESHPHRQQVDLFEITASATTGARYLRYYDESVESLEKLRPEREWWVVALLKFKNLGGEKTRLPSAGQISLESGSKTYDSMESFPRISWDQARPRSTWFQEPGGAGETVHGGQTAYLYLLFDVGTYRNPLIRLDMEGTHRFSPRFVETVTDS